MRLVDPYGVELVAHCHPQAGASYASIGSPPSMRLPSASRRQPTSMPTPTSRAMAEYPGRGAVDVRLDLPLEAAQESVIAPYGTPTADGARSHFQGRFDSLDGFARDLVSLGCRFTVSAPPELRAALRRRAAEIAALANKN